MAHLSAGSCRQAASRRLTQRVIIIDRLRFPNPQNHLTFELTTAHMIVFFRASAPVVYAVGTHKPLDNQDISKLTWLFAGATPQAGQSLTGFFVGPRKEMVTPWSTNAVEITQTMGIEGIDRIEEF